MTNQININGKNAPTTEVSANEATRIVESLSATYVGDDNFPLIEYETHLWNYARNSCEHYTIVINDDTGTAQIPDRVYELARQPRLISRVGRELI